MDQAGLELQPWSSINGLEAGAPYPARESTLWRWAGAPYPEYIYGGITGT